jgi:CDP-diacylglycerol---glycerol-3-phosphate 3-phosphatidyltransferase
VLIAMVQVSLLSTWIAALLLIRELVVQGVRQLAASADVVMPARAWGKGKTLATLTGMGLLLLAFDATHGGPLAGLGIAGWLHPLGLATLVVATLLSVASGLGYIRAALPLLLGRAPRSPT